MSNPPTPQRGRPRREVDPGARERLLGAAAVLFAEQGFAETSTREICTAAGLNPGAIHYHFGDKDGLYRAVLARPLEVMTAQYQGFDAQGLSLREGLDLFIGSFLSDTADELELRLHLREMLNPLTVAIYRAVGPDGKPGMYVLDPTTGKPSPINLAPVPKPQRGLRIQSDGQGGFSLYEGDGAQGVALTKPTEGKLQATAVDAQSGIDRLSGIRQGFDPKWLTYTEQAKQFANNVRQKAAGLPFVSKLSPQEEADLAAFSSFKSDTLDNLNLYIKEITGAAMGVEEAKRIVSTLPSLDDSPAAFQSKLNRTEERLRLVLARSVYTQKQGIKFDAMPIEQMRGIINRRGDELARELKDPAAVRSALEAEFFR